MLVFSTVGKLMFSSPKGREMIAWLLVILTIVYLSLYIYVSLHPAQLVTSYPEAGSWDIVLAFVKSSVIDRLWYSLSFNRSTCDIRTGSCPSSPMPNEATSRLVFSPVADWLLAAAHRCLGDKTSHHTAKWVASLLSLT